jgi:hypothetical protein
LSRSSAPVESTTFLPALSTGTVGNGLTSEPTASRMFLLSTTCDPPAARFTDTELGPDSLPQPLM